MKQILFFIISHQLVWNSWAQSTIQGRLIDAEQKPIEWVNILLFLESDTLKLWQGTNSDSLGNFRLTALAQGNYLLKFQLLGYQTQSLALTIVADADKQLGDISLLADTKVLTAIEVVAQKDFFQKTPQGLIINADATLSQTGGTAIDLLRNTPTVFVDAEGNLNLRGKTPLILLNGRNSSLSNLANIPATSIERIEIINTPGAQYDAEAENGIINIVLKKNSQNGINGAFALGAGYGARGRFNGSGMINRRAKAWNVGIAYDNRFAGRIRKVQGARTNFNLPEKYFLTQNRHDNRQERTHNLRANVDWEDSKNSFNLEVIGALEAEDNFETLFSTFETQTRSFVSKNRRFSEELAKGKVFESSINYQRKFTKPDQKLFFNLSTSFNTDRENTAIDTQDLQVDDAPLGDIFAQRTAFSEQSNVSNLRLDYTQKLGRGSLETGYKGILRLFESDFKQENRLNNEFQPIADLSGVLDFDEQIHAIYFLYKAYWGDKKKSHFEYEGGFRAEQTVNQGTVLSQNLQFNNSYLNFFPTASLSYQASAGSAIRLSYGRRINRPRLGQLNPFVDITDSLTQRSGNPRLQPELVHTLELSYARDMKDWSWLVKLFYRDAQRTILPFTVLRPNGVLFTRPENVGNTQTFGIESIGSYNPTKIWGGNVSFSLFQQTIDAHNIQAETLNRVLSWNIKWVNDIALWKGAKLQIIGIYNSPTATIQGTRIAIYNVDGAFQQKIWRDKARLGLIVTDIFDTQKNGTIWQTNEFDFERIFKVDTRSFLLTFAYTFGTKFKEKLMENQFSND
jgi:outer membrane receptor protein involved in Fe transport